MTVPARVLTAFSAALFCASIVANATTVLPHLVTIFPLFFAVHVALVLLGIWAVLRMRKLRTTWREVISTLWPVPKWILAAGAIGLPVVIYSGRSLDFDLGTLPDGTPVHSKNWRQADGKYWLSLNKRPATEISKADYERLQYETYAFFATCWVPLSYLILIQWHYIGRREGANMNTKSSSPREHAA